MRALRPRLLRPVPRYVWGIPSLERYVEMTVAVRAPVLSGLRTFERGSKLFITTWANAVPLGQQCATSFAVKRIFGH